MHYISEEFSIRFSLKSNPICTPDSKRTRMAKKALAGIKFHFL